jgi:predicted negative regulator of RcsB-dependent stress response
MEIYTTEEQQLEAIKKWFARYGNLLSWIVLVIAVICSLIVYWQHHQEVRREQASEHYISLITALEQQDEPTVKGEGDILLQQYPKSPYAVLSAFALALEDMKDNDFTQAETHLRWVLDHSQLADFKALAKIRLMRLLMAQNKLDQAIELYSEDEADGFLPLMAELRGDILFEQKELAAARTAYEKAYTSAMEEGMYGPLLKLKMEELGMEIPEEKEAAKS